MILGLLFEVPSWQSSLCKQCWASLPGRVSLNKCIIDRDAFYKVYLLLCDSCYALSL